jgi:hypothetical protein
MTNQRRELQDDDDATDAAHEAGDHRERHQGDVAAELEHAEQDLKQPGEHDHRERHRRVVGVLGDRAGHDHRHRPGRTGNLRRRAAEQRREETDEDRAVQSRDRPGAGRHAERKRKRQRDDRRRQAAENVAAQVVEGQPMDQRHPASPEGELRGPAPRGLLESGVRRTVFWPKSASLRRMYHKTPSADHAAFEPMLARHRQRLRRGG